MAHPKRTEEQHLIALCLKGDRRAQEVLYAKFYPQMMPICMSYCRQKDDAIDVYNQAFLKVFTKLDRFSGKGPFGAWVRQIVVRTAIDHIRSQTNFQMRNDELSSVHESVPPAIISELTANEILDLFRVLPPSQKLVLNLYILEGYSHKEIAEELGISIGTSKWHLSQGRKLLQQAILNSGIKREAS